MKLFKLPGLLVLRSLTKELTQIRQLLAVQTQLLSRLADQFAPIEPIRDQAVVRAESGVDFIDSTDLFLIQEFTAKHYNATGHVPTDDEVLSYLADEKTRDLHTRMIQRADELERLDREGR